MSTEIAVHAGNGTAETPAPKAKLTVGNKPSAIVPVDFEGAYRIANVVVSAGMAPKTLSTVEKAMVAILHGLEVGLTPMAALQAIAVINGRPTIWGDGAIGLVRSSGLLEWMKEYFEGDGPTLKAVCILKRRGEPEPVRGEFSMQDAKQAGLLGKEGPWQNYPKRMLQNRARAWPLRDTFADVLKGLHIREEVEDMVQSVATETGAGIQPTRRAVPSATPAEAIEDKTAETAVQEAQEAKDDGATAPKEIAQQEVKTKSKQKAVPPPISADERDWLLNLGGAFSGCEDIDSLEAEADRLMMVWVGKVSNAAWAEAEALLGEHRERIEG